MRARGKFAAILLLIVLGTVGRAQRRDSALSDAEVEKLRESAYLPDERVKVFIGFLDDRCKDVQRLSAGARKPGREEDLHAAYEQFTSIADELNDNLDDYGPRHRDLRKVLPKLIQATERWATILRTPPDNDAYNVSRKLALETLRDVREEAMRLVEEQKTYFQQHPPSKAGDGERAPE